MEAKSQDAHNITVPSSVCFLPPLKEQHLAVISSGVDRTLSGQVGVNYLCPTSNEAVRNITREPLFNLSKSKPPKNHGGLALTNINQYMYVSTKFTVPFKAGLNRQRAVTETTQAGTELSLIAY